MHLRFCFSCLLVSSTASFQAFTIQNPLVLYYCTKRVGVSCSPSFIPSFSLVAAPALLHGLCCVCVCLAFLLPPPLVRPP
ncbi:hypothetical protein HOY82DRAFT_98940 [Tuber indicum]|nr:hypothetical protein HOY82DRAFT_98940 [Tuber indicum]